MALQAGIVCTGLVAYAAHCCGVRLLMQVVPSRVMQRMTPDSLNLIGYVVVMSEVVGGHSHAPTAVLEMSVVIGKAMAAPCTGVKTTACVEAPNGRRLYKRAYHSHAAAGGGGGGEGGGGRGGGPAAWEDA